VLLNISLGTIGLFPTIKLSSLEQPFSIATNLSWKKSNGSPTR